MEEDCIWHGDNGFGADLGRWSFDVIWRFDLPGPWILVSYRVIAAECCVWTSLSRVSSSRLKSFSVTDVLLTIVIQVNAHHNRWCRQVGKEDHSYHRFIDHGISVRYRLSFNVLTFPQVISYIVIGALADAYPTTTHFNKGAAIVQVIFIYIIEMVQFLSLLLNPKSVILIRISGLQRRSRALRMDLCERDISHRSPGQRCQHLTSRAADHYFVDKSSLASHVR